MSVRALVMCALAACAGVQQRFPDDVQASLAREDMHKAETDHFIVYYPAKRRAELERFLVHAERCTSALRESALIKDGPWRDKMVVVMPDEPFNNAFVVPDLGGVEAGAVIPTFSTLDFATEFGIPPDPGFIACHELTHYTHDQQLAGFWRFMDETFGSLYSPQIGFDPWFFEGLATHYEAELNPGVGRPQWPIFTGMFAAAYAGHHMSSGELSAFGRLAVVGHHYLVGTMFIKFLAEKYGDRALWQAIAAQASAITGLFFPTSLQFATGASFGTLWDQFDAWVAVKYPARAAPAAQHRLAMVGNDARYARGRDGTEAWVADDVDVPAHLVVRDPAGRELASIGLVDVVPPRTLVEADPLLISGLSITADGREVWMTVIDQGTTEQVTRLVRWRRGDTRVTEIASGLGPGATIDPRGETYYYEIVDGDRWSLAAADVRTGRSRIVHDMAPGTYVLGAQISADGKHLAASVFDHGFAIEVIDADTGAIERTIRDDHPVYDPSFTTDGRLMWLGTIDGRFQVVVEGIAATDVPYAALAAREAGGSIRFLDREGWSWELAEVALPATTGTHDPRGLPIPAGGRVVEGWDRPAQLFDHFFYPQGRGPTIAIVGGGTLVGLTMQGGDRLGLQSWSASGYVQTRPSGTMAPTRYGGTVEYLNLMLAPLSIDVQASALDATDTFTQDKLVTPSEQREHFLSLTFARTFRSSLSVGATALYTGDFDQFAAIPERHVGGPDAYFDFISGESTRYTDVRRAIFASGHFGYYPHDLSTFAGDITDAAFEIGGVIPLPFGRRHTLTLSARQRVMVADQETGLLQLGGDGGLYGIYNTSNASSTPGYDDTRFPIGLHFTEELRGYEDYAITTDRASIVDASWRYPVIFDRGAAALWVLPAVYVRELDVELFGDGAVDAANNTHGAAGGALTLRFAIWRFAFAVSYQVARRFADDHAISQLISVAPDQ